MVDVVARRNAPAVDVVVVLVARHAHREGGQLDERLDEAVERVERDARVRRVRALQRDQSVLARVHALDDERVGRLAPDEDIRRRYRGGTVHVAARLRRLALEREERGHQVARERNGAASDGTAHPPDVVVCVEDVVAVNLLGVRVWEGVRNGRAHARRSRVRARARAGAPPQRTP